MKGVRMEKKLVRMKLADLVPYENNPRHNEEAVDATIASMQQCGNIDPIEVDEGNVILSGHTRRLALMKMGYEESDVMVVTGLTDLQKKKYRILANKTNEFASWDTDKLMQEISGIDFEGFDFGFDLEDIDQTTDTEYTDKTLVPQYEVEGESVLLDELYDSSKTRELIAEVQGSGVRNDEKEFLMVAAWRHTVFNYRKIAEYYANASEEMQKLMEKSALVIIDYENAIANGFATLSKKIEGMRNA